ncbi:nonribosomal peptide synthetase MxaA [Methylobacterium terricola]|uniref:Nonribosomal peptide synthetase MxaA n=1 Tax=Methylobacterium terricola TaxID=2583531 RepID=A0A5C4LJT9_9HYPH|nr:nonribosomal peptide synthetase MxaA [Methylobacterium terricola]TNC14032.1 nonribosomal peptide synthetase MxaA [Methylobacterium terricola]
MSGRAITTPRHRRPLRALWLAALLSAGLPSPAEAQIGTVVVRSPRPFGLFVGDRFAATVEIEAAEGFAPQAASLPKPGPLTAWLDLTRVAVAPGPVRDGNRLWRLSLTYQTFYAALDVRRLDVPAFAVTFASEAPRATTSAVAEVPGWPISVSPLREIQPPPVADPVEYMRPEGASPRRDPAVPRTLAGGFAASALAGLALLARDRAWWPFRHRPARAFAAAWRQVRRLAARRDAEAAYREALLALHRGLDRTDGRRVMGEDLAGFLARHPAYGALAQPLDRFFAASRDAFFGRDPSAAQRTCPFPDLVATARRLAAAERAARGGGAA